ncbi:MAG TPA: hypothetical protein VEJ89_05670 [Myxococcaceae bacterium]|jgi:hypothetical protein|nr:hypothetical protein [Myxococcaceae bacterium]
MRTGCRPAWLLASLAAVAGGCDAQVAPDYPGEPLVSLTGQVTSSSPLPLPQLEVGLLWQRGPPPSTDDEQLATRASVKGEFPAMFVLRLYHPAPEAARLSLRPGEVRFARANAAVLPVGVAQPEGAFSNVSSIAYAVDTEHWFLFLESQVPSGTLTEWWLGGALGPGYHLLRVEQTDPACLAPAKVAACVADLAARGVPDVPPGAGEATGYCTAGYRLLPVPFSEGITLQIGSAPVPSTASCP